MRRVINENERLNWVLIYNCVVTTKKRTARWRSSEAPTHTHLKQILPPSSSPHMGRLLREKSYQGVMYVCFLKTCVCVCVCFVCMSTRDQCTSLEIGNTLILFVITCPMRQSDPPVPLPTHPHRQKHTHIRWPPPVCYRYLRRTERVRLITCES